MCVSVSSEGLHWVKIMFVECRRVSVNKPLLHFQLTMFLVMNLECTTEDAEALEAVLAAITKRLKLERDDVAEITDRSKRREVYLLYLRFLNILMSRKKKKKVKGEDPKVIAFASITTSIKFGDFIQ